MLEKQFPSFLLKNKVQAPRGLARERPQQQFLQHKKKREISKHTSAGEWDCVISMQRKITEQQKIKELELHRSAWIKLKILTWSKNNVIQFKIKNTKYSMRFAHTCSKKRKVWGEKPQVQGGGVLNDRLRGFQPYLSSFIKLGKSSHVFIRLFFCIAYV